MKQFYVFRSSDFVNASAFLLNNQSQAQHIFINECSNQLYLQWSFGEFIVDVDFFLTVQIMPNLSIGWGDSAWNSTLSRQNTLAQSTYGAQGEKHSFLK